MPPLVRALVGAVMLAVLPGLIGGVLVGELSRRRGLRPTWVACACPPSLVLACMVVPTLADRVRGFDGSAPPDGRVLATAALLWLAAVAPVAVCWQVRRDRRDRMRGGSAAAALKRRRGPVDLWRGPPTGTTRADRHGNGELWLGTDDRGRKVHVPYLSGHCTIVGGSGSGKTNTAAVLLESHVRAGAGFVVLDGKGGRELPSAALALGARFRRSVLLWSVHPFHDPRLDARRVAWNPSGGTDATAIKDRIASAEEQTEPYYAAIAERGLQTAARALLRTRGVVRLDDLASLLEGDGILTTTLKTIDDPDAAAELAWLRGLNDGERSALRGMGVRLSTMLASTGGPMLLPPARGHDLDLLRAIRAGSLVVFTLPQGTYPKLIPQTAQYVLAALNATCTEIERTDRPANAIILVDELSAFRGQELSAAFERARSAGLRLIVATQSLSNFVSTGTEKLLHAALDNSELVIVHRQAVPDAAEMLAGIAGTEEGWEHTHKVDDRGWGASALAITLGLDETGERSRRLTDRFRAHPNQIKQLARGQAIVISHRPQFSVRNVVVRPGMTARTG